MGMTLSRALAGLFGKKEMRASFIRRFFLPCHPAFFDPNSLFIRYSYGNAPILFSSL